MSAADEARAEAEQSPVSEAVRRFPAGGFGWIDRRSDFVDGAEWQASRDAAGAARAEKDLARMNREWTKVAAINEALTTQLQAARATIAEIVDWRDFAIREYEVFGIAPTGTVTGQRLEAILSRADTSALLAHDEALIRQHTQTILDATQEATVQAIADAEVRGYQRKVDERITSALAASIEQTEADREPQPEDGPDYHAEHAYWLARHPVTPTENGENTHE